MVFGGCCGCDQVVLMMTVVAVGGCGLGCEWVVFVMVGCEWLGVAVNGCKTLCHE